ncbi:efflux RND transporter periplasmic adaptor subunit [Microbispora sp. NPDC049633]|uniref:efflux RND transporter periplasmic adaptor subunit n=1 Tax=Microbispora sp. NPDC049633 TaxID=3154355 RepID=UPI003448F5FA
MRSSTPLRAGGLALAGIVIASVAVISASGGDTSVADRIALASVRRGTVTSYVSAAGNTVDTGVRDLEFGAEGTVEKVYVKVGEKVRRGKVLARVDDTVARENYEAAKAALAAAQETLDDIKTGTATAGTSGGGTGAGAGGAAAGTSGGGAGAVAPGAGGAGTGTSGGGTSTGGSGASGRAGTSGGGTGSGSAGAASSGGGTSGASGPGAGPGNAGGSGISGAVACPAPSARPSARPSAQPSGRPSGQPSARPASQSSGQPASQPSSRPTGRVAYSGASTASVALVAYRGGDHGGDHGGPKPEPSPAPAPTRTPRPHANPSATHRPAPTNDGAATPDPGVSVSILPTKPAQQPSAGPSPSPRDSSSTCAPGQGGQGQGSEQGTQEQNRQGQGGGTQGRAGFGGGQAGQGGQGQGGQSGGARLTEAQAEAQVSQATTELAEAEKALAGVRIKAPADGTILSVAGSTGSRYTSGAFITLGDLDALQVQAMFTESDIRFLKVGQAATVTLSTQPGREYAGTVAHIDPAATTSNRLVRYGVTIDLENRPARLLLGQSATVRVTTGEAAGALYVPSQAVRLQDDGTAVVTVANGGTQARRTVRIGVRGDTQVEIADGLAEGDQVVLPGTTTAFPDEGFPAAR